MALLASCCADFRVTRGPDPHSPPEAIDEDRVAERDTSGALQTAAGADFASREAVVRGACRGTTPVKIRGL